MTDAEWYRNALAELGITQVKAAHLLGIDERTSRRYALGERSVPVTVRKLLEVLIAERHKSSSTTKRPVRTK